jgi:hypothetical protein
LIFKLPAIPIQNVRSPSCRNIFLPLGCDGWMTVRKLSISVPPEVEETIKADAAKEGKPVS